jgi:hypothetical protein
MSKLAMAASALEAEMASEAIVVESLDSDRAPTQDEIDALQMSVIEVALDDAVREMNKSHFVSIEGSKTLVYKESHDHELNAPVLRAQTFVDFQNAHLNKLVTIPSANTRKSSKKLPLGAAWLKHKDRRQYLEGMALMPGESTPPPGVYNLWRGWGAVPGVGVSAADVSIALQFIHKVICKEVRRNTDYLIGWLATGVQYPDQQIEVAVVLVGEQGVGKGTLGRWFRDLYGAHGIHVLHPRHLIGNFNAHLRQALALFVDEAFFAGDRAADAILKGLITEPNMMIERKGVDAVQVRNRTKILMATNSEHAVRAGADARRYFVLEVSAAAKQHYGLFGTLEKWWTDDGKEKFLGYLLEYDLSGFNVRSIPATAGLDQQKLESLGVFEKWLLDKLSDGEWSEDIFAKYFCQGYEEHVKAIGAKYENTNIRSIGKRIHKYISVTRSRIKEKNDRNSTRWIFPPRADALRELLAKLGIAPDALAKGEMPDAPEVLDSVVADALIGGAGGVQQTVLRTASRLDAVVRMAAHKG